MKAPRAVFLLAVAVLALALVGGISAAGTEGPEPATDVASTDGVPLGVQHGIVTAAVSLDDPSLAEKNAAGTLTKDQQRAYLATLQDKQNAVAAQTAALGGQTVTRLTKALDAVVVTIDRTKLDNVEALPNVSTVRIIRDYTYDLGETVPYIGAAALQAAGKTGAGVRVAVLDTGIDYTHRDFGGAGTLAAYTAAYGTTTADPRNKSRDGLFPTTKVVDGYDFTGEAWPGTPAAPAPLVPDDDPIDCSPSAIGCQGGHGTHVADIIAGIGPHPGVAPGAKLIAYKVCSSVSTSCSGVALLQAVDRMMDPNSDGDISDHVDVANLSLGSAYGQNEDDLTAALNNASDAGVIVAAAAGNNANLPYVASSPSVGKNIISVAQTQVPSAIGYALRVNSPPAIAGLYKNTETVGWAPIGNTDVTGDVTFVGRGCPANSITPGSPADPYLSNPSGKIALIDRGACAVSQKVDRAARAGAIGVIIGLVAPGDAVSFSFGGPDPFMPAPTLIITQATSNLIKGQLAPITRIGGGEVRVNRAVASTTAAWDQNDRAGSLSYGYQALSESEDIARRLVVRNYSNHPITYSLNTSFRYADDQSSGAVSFVDLPSSITVDSNNREIVWVIMRIDPSKLPIWNMNSGSLGGNGQVFNGVEYDGYLTLDGGSADSKISVPWHVLPHRSANVWSQQGNVALNGGTRQIEVENPSAVLDGRVEVFNLTGTSDRIAKDHLPGPGDNFAIVDLRSVGVRQSGSVIQFGIDTYGQRSHANYPAEFDIYIDSNNDGTDDFVVFNLENGGFGVTGQNVVEVFKLNPPSAGPVGIFFFTDADLNSGNAIMSAPMAAVGLTPSTKFRYSVYAFDNYFTGALTDAIENMTMTTGTPRFTFGAASSFTVPKTTIQSINISNNPGGDTASPSQLGFQLLYRDAKASEGGDPGRREGQIITVTP